MRSTDKFHVRIELASGDWMDWHCHRSVLAGFFKNGGLWIAIEVTGGEGYWWVEETESWARYPLYENDSPNVPMTMTYEEMEEAMEENYETWQDYQNRLDEL